MMQKDIVEFLLQNGRSLFLLILSGSIGYCVYCFAREFQRQKQPSRRRHFPRRSRARNRKVRPSSSGLRPAHPLHGKLIKLLNGDCKGAERLIASYQAKFPDKPARWHYEKAIYDLSRDRH